MYLKERIQPLDRILVWGQRARDLLGVGGPPGDAVHHRRRCSPATTAAEPTEPAQPASNVRPEEGTPELWQSFYEDFALHPPRYILDATRLRIRGAGGLPDLA